MKLRTGARASCVRRIAGMIRLHAGHCDQTIVCPIEPLKRWTRRMSRLAYTGEANGRRRRAGHSCESAEGGAPVLDQLVAARVRGRGPIGLLDREPVVGIHIARPERDIALLE